MIFARWARELTSVQAVRQAHGPELMERAKRGAEYCLFRELPDARFIRYDDSTLNFPRKGLYGSA